MCDLMIVIDINSNKCLGDRKTGNKPVNDCMSATGTEPCFLLVRMRKALKFKI